jgi:tRNA(Arg) A34 adenosine deaminase TadA
VERAPSHREVELGHDRRPSADARRAGGDRARRPGPKSEQRLHVGRRLYLRACRGSSGKDGAVDDETFLRQAIDLAVDSAGTIGGPFGSLVVKDGEVVGTGNNQVVSTNDPTAHAEIVALRDATRRLGTHVLSGCVVYASCEPCPMCLAAAFWSRVERVVFAATRHDAAVAGFDDAALYDELAAAVGQGRRKLPVEQLVMVEALSPFEAWAANPDHVPY